MVSRLKLQYCKIILATSLVWFLLDVVLLMYFTDCASNAAADCNNNNNKNANTNVKKNEESLLQRILPKDDVHVEPVQPLNPDLDNRVADIDFKIPKFTVAPTKPKLPPKPKFPAKLPGNVNSFRDSDWYDLLGTCKATEQKYSREVNHLQHTVSTLNSLIVQQQKQNEENVGALLQNLDRTLAQSARNIEQSAIKNIFQVAKSVNENMKAREKLMDERLEIALEMAQNRINRMKKDVEDYIKEVAISVDSHLVEKEKATLEKVELSVMKVDNNVRIIVQNVQSSIREMLANMKQNLSIAVVQDNGQSDGQFRNPELKVVNVGHMGNMGGDKIGDVDLTADQSRQSNNDNRNDENNNDDDYGECPVMEGQHQDEQRGQNIENHQQDGGQKRQEQQEPYDWDLIKDRGDEMIRMAIKCELEAECIMPEYVEPEFAIVYNHDFYKGKDYGLMGRPSMPGDMGKAVIIPHDREEESKEKFKIHQFNLVASEMMSLNRTLPDYRIPGCRKKSYPPVSQLPDTSVVIVFHNEAWSTLLRTVFSVINRSPPELLKEIILVDDASEHEGLGAELDEYLAKLPVSVYVLRTETRTGLIRARLKGAAKAKGKVITFLDAHCEATEGWLEPLMTEIHKDRTAVACPIIDVISDDTFEYITGSDMTWGGFNWKLNFRWYPVPQRELDRRHGDRAQPVKTPTMAGGLFSIDRDYFYEIGSYDEGMDIWGAENLEMSFRVWMCGGQVLIVTCSRVGHVFRKTSPYSWPGGVARIINHNTQRIVEVWMDEYKDFFYKINPGVKNTDYGDVTERKEFRKNKNCKSFKWYLENIYPESQMPVEYFALGEVKNKESGACIDSMGRKSGEKVGLVHCHGMGGNQIFSYTSKQALQTDDVCLDVSAINGPVKLFTCHGLGGNQKWEYNKEVFAFTGKGQLMMDENICITASGSIVKFTHCEHDGPAWEYKKETEELKHVNSNQCLGKSNSMDREAPSIGPCDGSDGQKWIFTDSKM